MSVMLRCAAEVSCCLGVYQVSKAAASMYTGDIGLWRRPTEESWTEARLLSELEDRKRMAMAEVGSCIAAMSGYAVFARVGKLANGAESIVTKLARPSWRVTAVVGLVCLNYGTAKLAYNVQSIKEQLNLAIAPKHWSQQLIENFFDEDKSPNKLERSKELNISTSMVETFIQPVVEGVMIHKYLYLRLLPVVGPVGATLATAVAFAAIHRDAGAPLTGKSLALDMADSAVLQSVFILTGGSAMLSIAGHILGNAVAAAVHASTRDQWSRYEEGFWWRYMLREVESKRLAWYTSIVPKGKEENISLSLMPMPPFPSPVRNPRCSIDPRVMHALCYRLFECYKQPGTGKMSPDDVADFIYAFRTASHKLQFEKFARIKRSGSVLGVSIFRSKPYHRMSLPPVICSDQAYFEAHRRYPDGMDLRSLIQFVTFEVFTGHKALSTNTLVEFMTRQELEGLCALDGPVCRWSRLRGTEEEEDDALQQVDAYYSAIRASLIDANSHFLNALPSNISEKDCEMPNIGSLLEGVSRSREDSDVTQQTDEKYYSDTLDVYARRSALVHLHSKGYTIRRWRGIMERLGDTYPDVANLRYDWLKYFSGPEFKYVMMNSRVDKQEIKSPTLK